jgi:hypothetical protein
VKENRHPFPESTRANSAGDKLASLTPSAMKKRRMNPYLAPATAGNLRETSEVCRVDSCCSAPRLLCDVHSCRSRTVTGLFPPRSCIQKSHPPCCHHAENREPGQAHLRVMPVGGAVRRGVRRRGLCIMARAMATRCCCPPVGVSTVDEPRPPFSVCACQNNFKKINLLLTFCSRTWLYYPLSAKPLVLALLSSPCTRSVAAKAGCGFCLRRGSAGIGSGWAGAVSGLPRRPSEESGNHSLCG